MQVSIVSASFRQGIRIVSSVIAALPPVGVIFPGLRSGFSSKHDKDGGNWEAPRGAALAQLGRPMPPFLRDCAALLSRFRGQEAQRERTRRGNR
jgi:hypothetical protein